MRIKGGSRHTYPAFSMCEIGAEIYWFFAPTYLRHVEREKSMRDGTVQIYSINMRRTFRLCGRSLQTQTSLDPEGRPSHREYFLKIRPLSVVGGGSEGLRRKELSI
jgi:hypothetical protein